MRWIYFATIKSEIVFYEDIDSGVQQYGKLKRGQQCYATNQHK